MKSSSEAINSHVLTGEKPCINNENHAVNVWEATFISTRTGTTKHNSANQSCLCLFDHSTATVVLQIGGVLPMFSAVIFVLLRHHVVKFLMIPTETKNIKCKSNTLV